MDAVAVELLLGELLDENDLRGDEDGGLALDVGSGDVDERLRVIVFAALETQAAFGHVFADDDVIAALGMADAGGVIDFDARVLAAIDARRGGLVGRGHGEDGSGALGRWREDFRQILRAGVERRSGVGSRWRRLHGRIFWRRGRRLVRRRDRLRISIG